MTTAAQRLTRFRTAEKRLWDSVGVSPTERRVHLDRCETTVRIQEVGEGPTVLFVHGATNGGTSWAQLVERLDGFHCVLLDRPGCGLSDPLPRALDEIEEIEAYADAMIPDVLDAIGVDTAHIIATSYGGYFALRAAAAHPDRIDPMVEFSWPFGAPMARVPLVMRLSSIPGLGRLMARIPPNERAVRMLLRQIGLGRALESGMFPQESVDWFVALLRNTPTIRNELRATPRIIQPIHGLNERVLLTPAVLGAITAPVLFFWGDEDPNGGIDLARPFVELVPKGELVEVNNAGHASWIDEPDRAADAVREFFSR